MLISEKATFFAQSYGKKIIPPAGMKNSGRTSSRSRRIDIFRPENYTISIVSVSKKPPTCHCEEQSDAAI